MVEIPCSITHLAADLSLQTQDSLIQQQVTHKLIVSMEKYSEKVHDIVMQVLTVVTLYGAFQYVVISVFV